MLTRNFTQCVYSVYTLVIMLVSRTGETRSPMKIEGGGGRSRWMKQGIQKRKANGENGAKRRGEKRKRNEREKRRWKQKQPGPNMMWIRYIRLILDIPGIQEAVQRCKCNQEGLN